MRMRSAIITVAPRRSPLVVAAVVHRCVRARGSRTERRGKGGRQFECEVSFAARQRMNHPVPRFAATRPWILP